MRTIDVTPSWEQILPALLLLLEQGTPESQKHAKAELKRMARLADEAAGFRKRSSSTEDF